MLYRLDKGPLSKIRDSLPGVKELQAEGFVLAGECDKDGNVISTSVVFDAVEAEGDEGLDAVEADKPKRAYTRKPREE